MNRALAIFIAAFPFVLALGLYATGTLERIDAALDVAIARHRWGLNKPPPGPAQPLASYAGRWQRDEVPFYDTEWVARIGVRTEGKRAWLHMWHLCGEQYCDQGEFEADVHSTRLGDVYALEVIRKRSRDVLWIVTLRPNGDSTEDSLLILEARRPKDPARNPKDNRSSFTSLRRAK